MPKMNLNELLSKRLEKLDNKDAILEALDLDSVQRTIDEEYVNPIVKMTKEDTLLKAKNEVKDVAVSDFVKSLKLDGVENVDAFKAYTKRLQATTEEKDEIITKYETELKELKPKYQETLTKYQEREAIDKVLDAGFSRKYAKDVYAIAKNKASDDKPLEDVLKDMKSEYKVFVEKPGDSGSYHGGNDPEGDPDPDKEVERWRREAGLK